MASNRVFFNIYSELSAWRIFVIGLLLLIGAGVLYYFNQLGKVLEEREKKYATLYAESIRFFIEKSISSDCDYTFVQELLEANETIPTILVVNGEPNISENIPELNESTRVWEDDEKRDFLYLKIAEMAEEHPPIEVDAGEQKAYVYYSNSLTLKRLRFFPFIILGTFFVFGLLAFIAYSSSRRAEQNRVWVGLAKETAHQLGTPISGLMGWVEVLRADENFDQSIGDEMEKDVERLETITTRFSNIGSVPAMKEENIAQVLEQTTTYLHKRISTKINWHFDNQLAQTKLIKINKHLFEWVIENLCKNAVDAMEGVGELFISISENNKGKVIIDIRDTGKGLPKSSFRKIFNAGYSTKKRGWGLGLTLAKRIIETYHQGRLYVHESQPGIGTTFRMVL